MSITIHITDVRKWCEKWRGEPFHAISLDPPYSYRFLQNKWDNDIALQKSTWQGFADHLLPCAWGAAYSSPQHYHRLAIAVEDAGFRIHPFILNWFNAQGFPKATKVQEHPSHYYGG